MKSIRGLVKTANRWATWEIFIVRTEGKLLYRNAARITPLFFPFSQRKESGDHFGSRQETSPRSFVDEINLKIFSSLVLKLNVCNAGCLCKFL